MSTTSDVLTATAPGGARRKSATPTPWPNPRSGGLRWAQAACLVGLSFAAVSAYWGLGGTRLLATVGRPFAEQGRGANTTVMIAAWVAAILKTIAAVLPLVALRPPTRPVWSRIVWVLAWIEAAILTLYGLVQTAVSLLVQADFIHPVNPNHQTLAWHAYLWDPWFLIWGLLIATALLRGRGNGTQIARKRGRRRTAGRASVVSSLSFSWPTWRRPRRASS